MNKLYSLLGIGLLSAATLNSCKEDAFTEKEGPIQQEKLQTYTTTASIKGHETTEKESSTRANVQDDGRSFMWNTNDKITIWDGTNGSEFSTQNYDGSAPSNNVEFTGQGSFVDRATVWGIYPKRENPTLVNAFVFTLGDNVTQSGSKPELQNTMHMLAKGTVSGTTVTNLNFEHLTALYQFSINNPRSDSYKVTSVSVSCETAIFPKKMTVSGEEKTYDEKVKSLTLTMSDLTIAEEATSHGYMSFFPMPDMTGDTELTFSVTVQKVGGDVPEVITKEVKKIRDLYNAESVVARDGYKYVAGKRYGVSFTLTEELGYEITGENQYLVKTERGLINLASNSDIMDNAATVITLSKDLDWQGKEAWASIADFKGTLDGANLTISNLKMAQGGFVAVNNGTIKNLTLKDVIFSSNITIGNVGALVAENKGVIQNCAVEGITITVTGASIVGGLVGQNTSPGRIENSKVLSGTINLNLTGAGKGSFGGLVGKNNGGSAIIQNSFVGALTIKHPSNSADASNVGGLVGENATAKVKGCYSLATITVNCSAQLGALVGAVGNGVIQASYAAGSISGNASNNAGGLIGTNYGTAGEIVACYSTTQLLVTGTKVAALMGNNNGTAKQCYFVQALDAVKAGSSDGMAKTTLEQFASKVELMNLAIETADAGFGFNFKVNTEDATKASQPLILQPAVKVPGFGGSDFENGGDI